MMLNRFVRLKGVGRFACLGHAVLEVLGRRYKIHNIQKGRIDYLHQVMAEPSRRCKPELAVPHLARGYVAHTVVQQATVCPAIRPEIVFMDSFSELTDQLFRHRKDGWQFCCNYLDLDHTDAFEDSFECLGLMELDGLESAYESMVGVIQARWPGIPVVYLHFPDALEEREKFVARAHKIRQVVDTLAARHDRLYSLSVPSEIVRRPEVIEPGLEEFPYHYNRETYAAFADMIRSNPVLRRFF